MGDYRAVYFLLKSKIARYDRADHDLSDVETAGWKARRTRLFSTAAMVRVPYFASIVPHVVRMQPGLAEVTVPNWFFVKRVQVQHRWATTPETLRWLRPRISSHSPRRAV